MFSGTQAKRAETAAGDGGPMVPAHSAAFDVLAARIAQLAPPDAADIAILAAWSIVHGLATLILDQRIRTADPAALAARMVACLDFGSP